jgi:hypothetical protein
VTSTKSEAAAAVRIGAGLALRKQNKLLGLLRPCFARTEPWLQAGKYVSALVSELPRVNGWSIARHGRDQTPDRTQRLLNHASWDTFAAMSVVRRFATPTHKTKDEHCPGSGQQPGDDAPLACWLPVRDGLTPHGLRHSHKTWMAEDGIPEILAEQRLGHDIPGMRGLYAHVSHRMREELTAALQARWEESLRERASIDPHSPVPLLDSLLTPFRLTLKKTISQIPPRRQKLPSSV